jgi:hypothetical protein
MVGQTRNISKLTRFEVRHCEGTGQAHMDWTDSTGHNQIGLEKEVDNE